MVVVVSPVVVPRPVSFFVAYQSRKSRGHAQSIFGTHGRGHVLPGLGFSFDIKEELASTGENRQIVKRRMLTFLCRYEGNRMEEVVEGQIVVVT